MRMVTAILGMTCLWASSVLAVEAQVVKVSVGKVSEAAFPEKVAKVIKGGAADTLLVEVLGNSVYLLPKTNTPADIFVTGISGRSYPLSLQIADTHDVRVDVQGDQSRHVMQDVPADAMALMKEVLLGHEPAGATVLTSPKTTMMADRQIKLRVDKVYDFPKMSAYILKAENMIDRQVILPLQQFSFPHLLAAASDADILKPQGQQGDNTNVYIIAGK